MNEEDIKIKYVLPWLQQAGVDVNDLQFERTFSVRIGRQVIQTPGLPETATGRLDILVRDGEKNLCIVETKAGHLALTDADRDQAISYARLVHPVAPYAIVTNGSEYRLYDSLSKARIDPSTIQVQGFEAALPDADLAEAQRIFLNLNPANMAAFCQRQVNGELQLVRGTVSDGKKYVPDLHVSREGVLQEIDKFYKGPTPGLMLIGESGSGKTCELCSVVESLLRSGKPVLFFNGFSLEGDVLGAVAREFSWVFNGSDLPIQVVKRIETHVGKSALTIVIDAIDEWRLESKVNNLASLLQAVEHRKIKLLVSCKASAVESFLFQRGNRTATNLLTTRFDIPAFSPQEFFEALQKYRRTYRFSGGFEDKVLDQARGNPFLLRVLFDVAENSNAKHLTFSSSEFFEAYYKRSIEKTLDTQRAARTLKGVARLLYEKNKEWISEDDLRAALGLTVNDRVMDDLFEFGMLVRSFEDSGESVISFYFQQFRDYIISFKVFRFDKMDRASLTSELSSVTFPSVRGAVLVLYYRLAALEHKKIFDSEPRTSAYKYLSRYVSLIQENFPFLEREFTPKGSGRVGFIGEFLLPHRQIGMHGVCSLADGEEDVHFVPVEQLGERSNLPFLAGAESLHFVDDGWGARNDSGIEAAVRKNELLPQITEFVAEGRLNESANPEMNCEKIVQIISQNKDIFESLLEPDHRSISYPIQLGSIMKCILKEKLTREFRDDLIQGKRKLGEINEIWDGDIVSYSYALDFDEKEAVAKRVDEALLNGEAPSGRVRYVELEELEVNLSESVNALGKSGIAIVATPASVKGYDIILNRTPMLLGDLTVHLQTLYAAFLSNYKILIGNNFPTLKSHFELYSDQPVAVHLLVESGFGLARGYSSMGLQIYFARSQTGADSVEIVEEVTPGRSENGLRYTVGGIEYEGISWTRTTVASIFTGSSTRVKNPFRGMSLRGLVYSRIQKELPAVKAFFLRKELADLPPDGLPIH